MNVASLLSSKFSRAGISAAAGLAFVSTQSERATLDYGPFKKAPITEEEAMSGSSHVFSMAKSIYGGENLALNIALGLGGSLYTSRAQGMRTKAATKKWHRNNRPTANAAMNNATSPEQLSKIKDLTKQHRAKVTSRYNKMYTPKAERMLGRASKMAMWAPLAFMAFDLTKSLANAPMPNSHYTPRKTAALSGTFMDTGMAFTQRKRALQAMHNSQYSGRAAMGNEAALVHR